MVIIQREWKPSRKLNAIGGALDFTALDPLPEEITRDQVEEYCYTLRQLYGEYIDELIAETTLSQREAQTWVLRNLVHEGSEQLSYEAIGLYIWAIGRATDGDPLSRTIVSDYYQRAEEKIQQAEETVKRTGPPPYPDDCYETPTLLWVEESVGERLAQRSRPEETYSDLIERLLDTTVNTVQLTDVIEILQEQGVPYLGIETVRPDWAETLRLYIQAETVPPSLADADRLRVDEQPYPFQVEADPTIRQEQSHLVVFDQTDKGPAVDATSGRNRVRTALETVELSLPALVNQLQSLDATALFIGEDPTGGGAHLYPVFAGTPSETVLPYCRRLTLDDRTLTVGAVTPISEDETSEKSTTAVWVSPEATQHSPLSLPEDPVKQRERLPTSVLRTA